MASLISPSDLKTILLSKRANLYYLEHCRVLCNGGRVEYVTDKGKQSLYWNIPIANTTTVLLGTGTSITQAAMREFARAGVMTGFCGGGGTPLFAASEHSIDIDWITPQSEYRPTEYLQNWCRFWFDDGLRLEAAKAFQLARLQALQRFWTKASLWDQTPVAPNAQSIEALVQSCKVAATNKPLLNTDSMFWRYKQRREVRGNVQKLVKFLQSDPPSTLENHCFNGLAQRLPF